MGFFGGDNEPDQRNTLADEQLRNNQAELEAKKSALYQTRIDIIKGQGNQNWQGGMTGRYAPRPAVNPRLPKPKPFRPK